MHSIAYSTPAVYILTLRITYVHDTHKKTIADFKRFLSESIAFHSISWFYPQCYALYSSLLYRIIVHYRCVLQECHLKFIWR